MLIGGLTYLALVVLLRIEERVRIWSLGIFLRGRDNAGDFKKGKVAIQDLTPDLSVNNFKSGRALSLNQDKGHYGEFRAFTEAILERETFSDLHKGVSAYHARDLQDP